MSNTVWGRTFFGTVFAKLFYNLAITPLDTFVILWICLAKSLCFNVLITNIQQKDTKKCTSPSGCPQVAQIFLNQSIADYIKHFHSAAEFGSFFVEFGIFYLFFDGLIKISQQNIP